MAQQKKFSLFVNQARTESPDDAVALYAELDGKGFAKEQGLERRTLFAFHGLLIELAEGSGDAAHRDTPLAAEYARRAESVLSPLFATAGGGNAAMRNVYQWDRPPGTHARTPAEGHVRTLIVARLKAGDASNVAAVFAESDATDLPHQVGIDHRSLFVSDAPLPGDPEERSLYFHLVAASQDITGNLYRVRSTPLYQKIHTDLAEYVTPYDPAWREPKDAMAGSVYTWTA